MHWGKRPGPKGGNVRIEVEKDGTREPKSANGGKPDARQERLAQALRANLRKRKENARATRTVSTDPDKGGQT